MGATCVSRMPNFFFITLMTSTGRILGELNMTHELGQENADYTINLRLVSLPQNVDICTTVVRIRAGNSDGMSAPSEAVEVGELGPYYHMLEKYRGLDAMR